MQTHPKQRKQKRNFGVLPRKKWTRYRLRLPEDRPKRQRRKLPQWVNEIRCTDCVEGMKALEPESIDLTVTSPPYDDLRTYNGFSFDFASVAQELYRVTKPGGVVVWVAGDQTPKSGPRRGSETGSSFGQVLGFKDVGFRLHDTMIHQKIGAPNPFKFDHHRYVQIFEFMFVFSKGKPKTFNPIKDRPNKTAGTVRNRSDQRRRSQSGFKPVYHHPKEPRVTDSLGYRTNVWAYPVGHPAPDELWKKHPAVFPLDLARDHVITWSNPGDTVFDPFAGSGQTLIAADQLGRQWLGMDLSQEYCDLAQERVEWFRDRVKAQAG